MLQYNISVRCFNFFFNLDENQHARSPLECMRNRASLRKKAETVLSPLLLARASLWGAVAITLANTSMFAYLVCGSSQA